VKPTETPEQHERSLERKRDTLRRHRERERAKSVQAWERLNAWLADRCEPAMRKARRTQRDLFHEAAQLTELRPDLRSRLAPLLSIGVES
jgi:hypothetical protein